MCVIYAAIYLGAEGANKLDLMVKPKNDSKKIILFYNNQLIILIQCGGIKTILLLLHDVYSVFDIITNEK